MVDITITDSFRYDNTSPITTLSALGTIPPHNTSVSSTIPSQTRITTSLHAPPLTRFLPPLFCRHAHYFPFYDATLFWMRMRYCPRHDYKLYQYATQTAFVHHLTVECTQSTLPLAWDKLHVVSKKTVLSLNIWIKHLSTRLTKHSCTIS